MSRAVRCSDGCVYCVRCAIAPGVPIGEDEEVESPGARCEKCGKLHDYMVLLEATDGPEGGDATGGSTSEGDIDGEYKI